MADRLLPFNRGEKDPQLAARIHASYAALPAVPASQVSACLTGVLRSAEAGIHPDSSGFEVRRHYWWLGAAAAAALIAVVTMRPSRLDDGSRRSVDSAAASSLMPVGATRIVDGGLAMQFELRLPIQIAQVALVGDFNGWDSEATKMVKRSSDGTWSAKIPLDPGVHNYAFIVDGKRWVVDPLAPQVPDEGFGPANAVVVVGSR